LIIFFVAINYIVRVGLAKVMGGKKEVATVQEIESAPNEESEKGGKV
jgi:simple sugar transport system permease protein